jgi:hypothetical protein
MKNVISLKTTLGLSAVLWAGLALPAWAKTSKPSSCTDIPVQVALAPLSGAAATPGGIYGDGQRTDANGNTLYTDGVDGVSAKFQVCNTSYDFVLNMINTTRYFWADFSGGLSAPSDLDPGATALTGPVQGNVMNVNEVANSSLYSNNVLNTCTAVGLAMSKGMSASTHFTNTTLWPSEGGPANLNCPDGTLQQVADKGGDTSLVQVTFNSGANGSNCSWTVTPLPLETTTPDHFFANGAQGLYVTGLVEQPKNQYLFGGDYNMPFTVTLTRLDGGCFPQ